MNEMVLAIIICRMYLSGECKKHPMLREGHWVHLIPEAIPGWYGRMLAGIHSRGGTSEAPPHFFQTDEVVLGLMNQAR